MSRLKKFQEIFAQYQRHGWRLARVLARPESLAEMRVVGSEDDAVIFEGAPANESDVDALWFTRPSAEGREAWELRLVGDTPYALFELFEPDEEEEDREDVRREMEARLREYAAPGTESIRQ
jgi:radical SAM superfamily enzyme with C-terminal helix-hairpin-helix motif